MLSNVIKGDFVKFFEIEIVEMLLFLNNIIVVYNVNFWVVKELKVVC